MDRLLDEPITCLSDDCECGWAYRGKHESLPLNMQRMTINAEFVDMVLHPDRKWVGVSFSQGASATLVANSKRREDSGTVNQWQS